MKILVVDDSERIRKVLTWSLSDFGAVTTAANGFNALAVLKHCGDFDVVVSDYIMPEMKGDEFIRQVKALWPEIFVILISGHEEGVVAQVGLAIGANKVLHKPFGHEDIERAMMEVADLIASRV